ncbi:MAG: hypothetical protein AB2603_14580 [Candidatus Thiodiazotropha endolucinida]
MNSYTLFVLKQGVFGLISALIPAISYWLSNPNATRLSRVKLILPSLIIVSSFVFTALISTHTTIEGYEPYWWVFQATLLLAVISIMYSVMWHDGNNAIHITHLFTLFSVVYLWFVGGMALSHDWP